jgi:hypothetical protein
MFLHSFLLIFPPSAEKQEEEWVEEHFVLLYNRTILLEFGL